MTASAGMPLPVLLGKLGRQGLCGLDRRHGLVLRALADVLPHRSAEGRATVGQLAAGAGYSTRWVAETLGELELLGVVEWQRGGVVAGRPQPSRFRVVKAALCRLLTDTAAAWREQVARQRARTAARVAGLGSVRLARSVHRRRSSHVEAGSTPTLSREVTAGATAPLPADQTPVPPPTDTLTELRQLLRRQRRAFLDG